MAARELMWKSLIFLGETVLIKTFSRTLEERLVQQGGNLESKHVPEAGEVEVAHNYRDVVSEDWSPRLYQRIESIIQEGGRLMLMELHAALQMRLEGMSFRRNGALNPLAEFIKGNPQDYYALMHELLPLTYAELTGKFSISAPNNPHIIRK